ncbi:MAG TPA: hypothetical protein VGK00_01575 [Anaerolineales bacterium]|jgi:hypothetical protein
MDSQYIVIAIAAVFVGWFALGMIYNLRRGDALIKWMQAGLPLIGQKTTFRWLGTSVAQMGITHARRPFLQMDVLVVLKPRDVFWMTIISWFQGRDDILILRGALSTPALVDLEFADPKTWSGREALNKASKRGWDATDYKGLRLMAPKGLLELATTTLDQLKPLTETLSPRYYRLSLRKTAPNMELHVPFPDVRSADSNLFFQALSDLGRAIGERK